MIVHLVQDSPKIRFILNDDELIIYDFNLALQTLREFGTNISELRIEYLNEFKNLADQLNYYADEFCSEYTIFDAIEI